MVEEVIIVALQKLHGPIKFVHKLWPNGLGFNKRTNGAHNYSKATSQADFKGS